MTDEGQDFKNVESVSGGSWLFRFRLAKKGEPGGPWEGWGPARQGRGVSLAKAEDPAGTEGRCSV
ncbi:MAG: hypothetical protein CW346_02885 [Bacillaceae bacterium]|nr:hypothetical protein [Bacillaceae bacterium]